MNQTTTDAPGSITGPVALQPRSVRDLLAAHRGVAMITTTVDGRQTSRPVRIAGVTEHRLSFLVSADAAWVHAISSGRARLHVTVTDEANNVYLGLNGDAVAVHDQAEIERLWENWAHSFFHGPDDPQLVVLHVDITDGHYWEGPSGRLGRVSALIRAALVGDEDAPPDHGPIVGVDADA